MSRPLHRYAAYGLRVQSPIALPFAPASSTPDHEPDVTIRVGAAPPALPAPMDKRGHWESAPGAFLLNVDGVARYLVTAGRDILVEPRGGGDRDMGVFLAGSVFAALLQQRGVVTFHASAIETGSGAVLFLGRSGDGKSSLLAAMVQRGHAMLADDVAGVVLDRGGRPTALSAFPCARLWADALDELGWQAPTRGRVREGLEKYLAPVERFRATPLAVRAAYMLTPSPGSGIEVEPCTRPAAFERLSSRYTYRKRYLSGLGQRPAHFRAVTAMAKQVPVFRVKRPVHPVQINALADEIERSLCERGAETVSPAAGAFG